MFKIKLRTKRIFWTFPIFRTAEWRRFVTDFSNNPRSISGSENSRQFKEIPVHRSVIFKVIKRQSILCFGVRCVVIVDVSWILLFCVAFVVCG